ncbi:MAG: hypothetical protein WBH86_07150 [Thermogutta sp.]
MSLSFALNGATDRDDGEQLREHLRELVILFRETNIYHDPETEGLVIFFNRGYPNTPSLVFGGRRCKIIVADRPGEELNQVLARVGYLIPT